MGDSMKRARRYCLGFAFDESCNNVLLIRKNKPEWQRGLLNGVGGHVEEAESQAAAMVREAKEETGLLLLWRWVCVLQGINRDNPWRMHVYAAVAANDVLNAATHVHKCSEGELQFWPVMLVGNHPRKILNLEWLIPLCQQTLNGERVYSITTITKP